MKKSWVFTARVEPPVDKTVSVRFGASVMFAAYSSIWREWFMVAGSYTERIEEPPMIFLDKEYVKEHQRDFAPPKEKPSRHRKRPVQLSLHFSKHLSPE